MEVETDEFRPLPLDQYGLVKRAEVKHKLKDIITLRGVFKNSCKYRFLINFFNRVHTTKEEENLFVGALFVDEQSEPPDQMTIVFIVKQKARIMRKISNVGEVSEDGIKLNVGDCVVRIKERNRVRERVLLFDLRKMPLNTSFGFYEHSMRNGRSWNLEKALHFLRNSANIENEGVKVVMCCQRRLFLTFSSDESSNMLRRKLLLKYGTDYELGKSFTSTVFMSNI